MEHMGFTTLVSSPQWNEIKAQEKNSYRLLFCYPKPLVSNLVDSNARNWGLWAMSSLPRYSQICESDQGSAFVVINVELKSQVISLRQF